MVMPIKSRYGITFISHMVLPIRATVRLRAAWGLGLGIKSGNCSFSFMGSVVEWGFGWAGG
jgi:hypothetical protein